jgi:DNA-binding NarL/FixJ family response regulator
VATVAIHAPDADLRREINAALHANPAFTIAGSVGDDAALTRLLDRHAADVVLTEAAPLDVLSGWRRRYPNTAFVVVAHADADGLDALAAGVQAVLPRGASGAEIAAAILAAHSGLSVLPRPLLAALLEVNSIETREPPDEGADSSPLTARERDVLAAMADGASNKVIARRLGISYHTVKFHVAAILAKLDADSRTEAVARAAHLGLVML